MLHHAINYYHTYYPHYTLTMNFADLNDLSRKIEVVPNFKGVTFRNVNSLLKCPGALNKCIDLMAHLIKASGIRVDMVALVDARGFLFSGLCDKLGCGSTMIRKKGKTCKNSYSMSYGKEYGEDIMEIETDLLVNEGRKPLNVVIVDDLFATGGTVNAARKLIKLVGGNPVASINLVGLTGLSINQELVDSNMQILSLFKYQFDSPLNDIDRSLNSHLDIFVNDMQIKQYEPLIQHDQLNSFDTIVFYHPTVESLAENYVANNDNSRKGCIVWNKFPDKQPNITFEDVANLRNKRIVFFMTLYDSCLLFEQLSMLKILPRQFIKSLDIYICYFAVGTMERVDKEGMLATADTMASIISNCLESCIDGKPTIHIYDIHALQNRFYFDYSKVQVEMKSAIPLFRKYVDINTVIVFPDDGAHKRFGHCFPDNKTIICSKVRDGNTRRVVVKDKLNFGANFGSEPTDFDLECIIVDDLVQSGGTLVECKKVLNTSGYTKVSAYVTHCIFPNDSWKKIVSANFHKFYMTNSVPEVSNKLRTISPFVVIDLFGNESYDKIHVYVASHNKQKLEAAWKIMADKCFGSTTDCKFICKGVNVQSCIPEQPIGHEQIKEGSTNRMNNMVRYLNTNNIYWDYCISFENGIIESNLEYLDVCGISILRKDNHVRYSETSDRVKIPKRIYDKCIEYNQEKTVGQIIQDETGIPKDSFHQYFNERKRTRVDIMANTLAFMRVDIMG